MNLYLVSKKGSIGYDEYDSVIVSAKSTKDARTIHPDPLAYGEWSWRGEVAWIRFSKVDCLVVEYLGKTKRKRGVVLSSFNAA